MITYGELFQLHDEGKYARHCCVELGACNDCIVHMLCDNSAHVRFPDRTILLSLRIQMGIERYAVHSHGLDDDEDRMQYIDAHTRLGKIFEFVHTCISQMGPIRLR